MRVIRAAETVGEAEPGQLQADWVQGPTHAEGLDVGLIHFAQGAVTPPHLHVVGQVLVAMHGQGFVEVDGVRTVLEVGDVAVTAGGQMHTHGATEAGPFTHLSVTTGAVELPAGDHAG